MNEELLELFNSKLSIFENVDISGLKGTNLYYLGQYDLINEILDIFEKIEE